MNFSQYLEEEKITEDVNKIINELFGDSEADLSRKIAAKNILKDKNNTGDFLAIFADKLIKRIVAVLTSLPEEQKQKGAYLAYLILQSQGKDSKWFKIFKTTNQSLLTHKDKKIKQGAHLAKRDIEVNRPESLVPSKPSRPKPTP